jgi:Arc/MetJ-type ribon-helix-helix transcriptional regulator
MASVGVRIPEDQEKKIEEVVEEEAYPSKSEFVREAIRNELRERISRKQLEEIMRRKERHERGEGETISHEELMKEAGLED